VLTTTAYASVSATYDKIDSALNTLELRAEAQPMNSDTSTALAKVKDSFDRLRQRHQAGTLDIGHAQDEYCILRADFRVLTQMELAKKR